MAITTNGSYVSTANDFLAHWQLCNNALPPASPLLVRVPDKNTLVSRVQLLGLRDALVTQQGVVQSRLADQQLAQGSILTAKTGLLAQFNQLTTRLDANFRNTNEYRLRPYAPNLGAGQGVFSEAIGEAMTCWDKVNASVPPAGVTLPLTLPDGTTRGSFASTVSTLQFLYADEKLKAATVTLEQGKRNDIQVDIYEVLKAYREKVPDVMEAFPLLVESMPRLTPLPGHTPAAVNASAVFEAPNAAKVGYDASTDALLHSYQLRGNVGDEFSDEDAIVIATNAPNAPREFVTPFGLGLPGARVALKVYVILTTGNEEGSGALFVTRPALAEPLAA